MEGIGGHSMVFEPDKLPKHLREEAPNATGAGPHHELVLVTSATSTAIVFRPCFNIEPTVIPLKLRQLSYTQFCASN